MGLGCIKVECTPDKLRTLLFDDESSENEIFRENSLFLSTLATFGFGKLSKQIVDSLGSILIISGLGHQGMVNYAGKALEIEKKKKYILDCYYTAIPGI